MKILQEILVPHDSVNDLYLTVVGLNFKNGDKVKKHDVVIELETSKSVVTVEANIDGYVNYLCSEEDEVLVNAPIVQILDEKPADTVTKTLPDKQGTNKEAKINNNKTNKDLIPEFSLKALEMIWKNNLSKEVFAGFDFVNEQVVNEYINPGHKKAGPTKQEKSALKNKLPDNVTVTKLNYNKKREIEYLSSVQGAGLVSTLYIDVNTKNVLESVSEQFVYFKDSLLPVIVYECSKLLLKYPALNAFYIENGIANYNNVHIGVAIDIDDGLKVVRLPDTSNMGMKEIEDTIFELSNKYLDKKLTTEELTDITFTITDLSASDVTMFAPLINKNNAAILGISSIDTVLNKTVLSLAFDHRVTEGKIAGNFLSELKQRIESYADTGKISLTNYTCYKCLKNISEDINDVGFIKVFTKNGEEKLICDVCLFNF